MRRKVMTEVVKIDRMDKAIGWLLSKKDDGNITNIRCNINNNKIEDVWAFGDIHVIYIYRYGELCFIARDKNNRLHLIEVNPIINDPNNYKIGEGISCPTEFWGLERYLCIKYKMMPHGGKFDPTDLKEVLGLTYTGDKYYTCG